MTTPEEFVREARLDEALKTLKDRIRSQPADASLRVFLFQLESVLGNWDRALTAINVAAELESKHLLLAQMARPGLQCEALRAEVFAGRRRPLFLGEPARWVGLLLQAHELVARGEFLAAQSLRDDALSEAPAVGGRLTLAVGNATAGDSDEEETELTRELAFEWIADADSRLGPTLELVLEGKYYWVPFDRIRELRLEPPMHLRDLVWAGVTITWINGGHAVGWIPVRYAGTEAPANDDAVRLARRTEWIEHPGGTFLGVGQRVFATDEGDHGLLEIRRIDFDSENDAANDTANDTGGPDA